MGVDLDNSSQVREESCVVRKYFADQQVRSTCIAKITADVLTDSVVINGLKMYHMAGKFKLTGDGEFLIPKEHSAD